MVILITIIGYRGVKSCVLRAALRARLDIDNAHEWSSLDVHRLVAHYLSIRFPICLALNKVDALPEDENGVIIDCQRLAQARGEAAIPMSAQAETWVLYKQANNISFDHPELQQKKEWMENEDCLRKCVNKIGSTGVILCI